jgi:hypothetical protein
MRSTLSQARRAGLLYVLASSVAPFAYLYVPGVLIQKEAHATAERVRAFADLLRAAIALELVSATLLVFAAVALYELFKDVERRTALVMLALMLVSVPISYVNVLFHLAPLVLVKNASIAGALGPDATAGLVGLFLFLHNYGLAVNQVFWGLWLFPIGMLVRRSGLFPRWLGIPLYLAGAGYVINSFGTLLLPPSLRWITDLGQVLGVGELPFFTFYLLLRGVRGAAMDRPAAGLAMLSFAIGMTALALLMLKRIDALQYGLFGVASLAVTAALVMRWRVTEAHA